MGLRFRKSFKITPKWKFIVLGIVILAIIVALISQRSLTSLNVSWEKTSFEVGESTTVKITPEPVDFDLSNSHCYFQKRRSWDVVFFVRQYFK